MRAYRQKLVEAGQSSPIPLSRPVIRLIKREFKPGIKILDVGCGLGHQMLNIKTSLPNYFSRIEGIDWSPSTVEYHRKKSFNPFENVALCRSEGLPYEDNEFDICLSMENLEHLYGQCSIDALSEMARVARHVIITTPSPEYVINFNFLHQEIKEAVDDPLLLTQREFVCLESAVHKSILLPHSMIEAGFKKFGSRSHSFFWAKSDGISLDKVDCIGIIERNDHDGIFEGGHQPDYRYKYVMLLADSIGLDAKIAPHKAYSLAYAMSLISSRLSYAIRSYLLRRFPSLVSCLKVTRRQISSILLHK